MREAPFILQVEDEGTNLGSADVGGVGGVAVLAKEVQEIVHASGDNFDRFLAFTLAFSAQAVALDQAVKVGW